MPIYVLKALNRVFIDGHIPYGIRTILTAEFFPQKMEVGLDCLSGFIYLTAMIAFTPTPPYYAVIFTSLKTNEDSGYDEMAHYMEKLVVNQPGYLGHEFARSELGITVSYWESLEAIKEWKNQLAHRTAQEKGKEQWYASYRIRVCLVEKEYGFPTI